MKFGLTDKSYNLMINAIQQFSEIEEAVVFGSRALGNFKSGSDVDIALKGTHVTDDTARALSLELNEKLPIPYYFDVLNYQSINEFNLKAHIDQNGQQLYMTPKNAN